LIGSYFDSYLWIIKYYRSFSVIAILCLRPQRKSYERIFLSNILFVKRISINFHPYYF
jgi:hypothetical protein